MSGTCEPTWKCTRRKAVRQALAFEVFAGRDQFRRGQAELGVLAAARRPLARALALQAGAQADHRLDADLARDFDDLAQLLELLDDEDDLLAQLAAQQARSG